MEGYGFQYPQYPTVPAGEYPHGEFPPADYPDHGDGYPDYYGMRPMSSRDLDRRPSRTKHRSRAGKRSRSASASKSRSISRSNRSKSRSRSRSKSRSSRSRSVSRVRDLNLREPSFLDAFRVLYLTPSKSRKSTTKYLATKKRQDRIEEVLKSDGLGSKRWLFYPRSHHSEPVATIGQVAGPRDNSDQRVKIDGQFFKKYKRSKSVNRDAPVAKLKRWELVLYKKLGFIRAE
ncbi:uncharacterized protein [Choristoneura fumiferana]|uniref:uncharacterized protein n=1 Tax=Choristoneura fumiferana TaxID=7141 RepID=UPI003D15CE07